jgi:hypothetical protein
MVLPYKGTASFRGPIGISPGQPGGRIPGPLGFKQVVSKSTATKASKSLPMPAPWKNSDIIRAAVVNWKLANGKPVTTDVQQGTLANCPIAAVLAALTNTARGQEYVDGLITEYRGASVQTVLDQDAMARTALQTNEDPDDRVQDKTLVSNRYFSVKLGKQIEVHDTFFVYYTDGTDLDLVYMKSPNDVLWPAVIEKACALHYGSYIEIGDYKKHTANEFWEFVVGKPPAQGLKIDDFTAITKISNAVQDAAGTPTIAASREKTIATLTPIHGYAVLGVQGNTIELYDPSKAKSLTLSFEDFRSNFQTILSGKP